MNKRFHLVSIVTGNLLTIGAIFIYAMQSQVGVALSTYALVMGFLVLCLWFSSIYGGRKTTSIQSFSEIICIIFQYTDTCSTFNVVPSLSICRGIFYVKLVEMI